jgi:hypothetical protein
MSNRQRTLKDFSELKIEERINVTALGIFQLVFKGEANAKFEPAQSKSQVHRVWSMKKLNERQQIAWVEFIDTIKAAHGESGKVCGSYGEYISNGSGDGFRHRDPVAKTNHHHRKIEGLKDFLTRHEKALLLDLLQDTLKSGSGLQLETIGLVRSGYSDKVSARAAGVVHIQVLLDRLAEYFRV